MKGFVINYVQREYYVPADSLRNDNPYSLIAKLDLTTKPSYTNLGMGAGRIDIYE